MLAPTGRLRRRVLFGMSKLAAGRDRRLLGHADPADQRG